MGSKIHCDHRYAACFNLIVIAVMSSSAISRHTHLNFGEVRVCYLYKVFRIFRFMIQTQFSTNLWSLCFQNNRFTFLAVISLEESNLHCRLQTKVHTNNQAKSMIMLGSCYFEFLRRNLVSCVRFSLPLNLKFLRNEFTDEWQVFALLPSEGSLIAFCIIKKRYLGYKMCIPFSFVRGRAEVS